MTAAVKEAGLKANGYAPYLIMQANHSGRYSNPRQQACPDDRLPPPDSGAVPRRG